MSRGGVKLLAIYRLATKPRLALIQQLSSSLSRKILMKKEVVSLPGQSRPLLAVLNGERLDPPPLWMMRQAGRYLPEYRALRAEKGGFLALVHDSAAAADVTLQPLRRFAFDAAILFSVILVIPHALGQDLMLGLRSEWWCVGKEVVR